MVVRHDESEESLSLQLLMLLEVPTLVIHGDDDRIVPIGAAGQQCNGEAAASPNFGIPSIKDIRNPLEDIISRFLALRGHLPQTTGRKRGCRNARRI